jgi:hypothetical protein
MPLGFFLVLREISWVIYPQKTLEGKNLDDDLSFHAYLSLLDPHDWTFVQTSPVEIGCVGLCKSSGSRQICFALDG